MATETLEETRTRAKVRALTRGVRVWVLEEGRRYVTPSCSDDGTAYELTVGPGYISCTCLGAFHGRTCQHMGAVALRLELEATE